MSFGSWKTQGLSGLSIIVILSECYLQKIEHIPVTHALTLDIPRKSFKRFVDGSHVKFGKREQSLQLLDIICHGPSIQITIEFKNENKQLVSLI